MAWRFRKSFSPIPGIRVTLSPSGISTSVGVGPLRVGVGPGGANLTTTIPGTGLAYRQPLGTGGAPAPNHHLPPQRPPAPSPSTALPGAVLQEIKSAESSTLTSSGLAAFKQSLDQADRQFSEINAALQHAREQEAAATDTHRRWAGGWLLKHVRKQRFAEIGRQAEEAAALRVELEEQLQLSRLPAQFEMPDGVARAYEALCEAFRTLTRSQRIWDNVAHRAANRVAERTTASRVVELKEVRFDMGRCAVIESAAEVPRMENANGGDLFFYPGFLVYHAAARNYALVEYGDLELSVRRTRFHEESSVPGDAKQVATTWAKANKDGSQDLRFKDNHQIPVMQYATLTLRTASGLNEEYMVSNVEAAEGFAEAWRSLRQWCEGLKARLG